MGPRPTTGLLMAAMLATPLKASAQSALTVLAGGATSLPAADAVGDAALFGIGGLAFDWTGDRVRLVASAYGGLSADEMTGADFGSASTSAEVWTSRGSAIGLTGRGSAFRIQDPFTYRVRAVRGGPAVRLHAGPLRLLVRGEVGAGSTLVEVERPDGRVRRAERDLWGRGVDVEAEWRRRSWAIGVGAGHTVSSGGDFTRGSLHARWVRDRLAVQLETGRWDTPLGGEWTGSLAVIVPLGGPAHVAVTAGRAGPDPLTLVESGDQGGVMVSWKLVTFGKPAPDVALLRWEGAAATVQFRLEDSAVRAAERVEVIGDFTAWSPEPLRQRGSAWVGELPVAPGIHHFGFLVDGEWFVPADRSGNVPDEWGRMNATLVVAEREGRNES